MAEKKKVEKRDRRYRPVTAADQAAVKADKVAADAATFAEQEGVSAAAYVDYVPAMENYESRSDVETLAHRRLRDNGGEFRDQWHAVDSDGNHKDEVNGLVQDGDLDADSDADEADKQGAGPAGEGNATAKKAAPSGDKK